jgi:hypothetical protein
LAVGFVLGLQAVLAAHGIGLTGVKPPTLLFLGAIGAALVISSFTLVFWLISLRRSAAVLEQAAAIAQETLRSFGGPKTKLRERAVQGVASPFTTHYVEQEILKMCVYTLTEAAIRAIEAKQRFQAREAIRAVAQFRERAEAALMPDQFFYLWRTTDYRPLVSHPGCRTKEPHIRHPLWLYELLAESLESVLLISAELHYQTVGIDASKNLVDLGRSLIAKLPAIGAPQSDPDALVDRIIQAYEFAIDECVQFVEVVLVDFVLSDLSQLLGALPTDAGRCQVTAAKLEDHLFNAAAQAGPTGKTVFLERALATLKADTTWPQWVRDAAKRVIRRLEATRPVVQ